MKGLCDELEALRAMTKPIGKMDLLNMGRANENEFRNSLFLSAFTTTFKGDRSDPELRRLFDATEVTLVLLANGIPLDATKTCLQWESQVDRMVGNKARAFVDDKLRTLRDAIDNITESVKSHAMSEMAKAGIEPREEY